VYPTSAQSANRGDRPAIFILDDPEQDFKSSTNSEVKREQVHELIFKVMMPMLEEEGSKGLWIGTVISKKHFIWKALRCTKKDAEFYSKFQFWNRIHLKAFYDHPEHPGKPDKMISLWPEMHPQGSFKTLLRKYGPSVFWSEF